MTEETQNNLSHEEGLEEAQGKEKGILLLFRFILIPLILVGIVVFVIVIFGQMALKEKSVKDYLYDIRTGSQSERWQAAYHLSNLLANPKKDYRSEARKQLPEMILIFEQQGKTDPQIRRYLALALGSLQDPRAVPPLQKAMNDDDAQTVIFSLWAIGNIGDKGSTPLIAKQLENQDSSIRVMSAYVLGALADPRSIPSLQAHLSDDSAEVTWNSAIALSRMNDASGADILMKLLDRKYLNGFQQITEERKEEVMVNAIKAARKLNNTQLNDRIRALSTSDSDPKVRDAALKALQQ